VDPEALLAELAKYEAEIANIESRFIRVTPKRITLEPAGVDVRNTSSRSVARSASPLPHVHARAREKLKRISAEWNSLGADLASLGSGFLG
jgi:hypothetical protein